MRNKSSNTKTDSCNGNDELFPRTEQLLRLFIQISVGFELLPDMSRESDQLIAFSHRFELILQIGFEFIPNCKQCL